ncbi:MAG: carboxypeptidase regulatory-like domain-containing protein [Planctomycetes bacterium]|nr:carboxypeptidase regulatory-like domain-containing protein [Planctomycetota bacterium]
MTKRRTEGALILALLLAGAGFADQPVKDKAKPEKDTPDLLMKDVVKAFNELADLVETLKDKASAAKAKPKFEDIVKKMETVAERAKKIGKLSRDRSWDLEKKYQRELEAAAKKMQDAFGTKSLPPEVMKDVMPQVLKVLTAFEKVGKTLGLDEYDGKKSDDTRDETKMKTGRITGKVTYDGKLVPVGTITFISEKGGGVLAVIHNGKYTADKVPPGPVTITVNTREARQLANTMKSTGGKGPSVIPSGGQQSSPQNIKDKMKDKGTATMPGAEELAKKWKETWEKLKDMIDVPEKFADPKTSGLTYTVKAGLQKINVDMPKVEIKKKDPPKQGDKKGDK